MTTRSALVRHRPVRPHRGQSASARTGPAHAGRGRQPRRIAAQAAPAEANVAALSSVLARTAQALAAQAVPRTVFWTDRWSPA